MRRVLVTVLALGLLMALMFSVSAAQDKNFTAHLTGGTENPPNDSAGQGQVKLKVDGDQIHFKLITANLDGITQAHIHCGGPDVNGPVVVFLFGLEAAGVDNNGVLNSGSFAAGDFTPPANRPACADITTIDHLVDAIASGEAYANVHTLAFPPGEIRGNLP